MAQRGAVSVLDSFVLPEEEWIGRGTITREWFRRQAWDWFRLHADDTVLRIRVLKVFSISVELKDLRGLWIQVFGQEPLEVVR